MLEIMQAPDDWHQGWYKALMLKGIKRKKQTTFEFLLKDRLSECGKFSDVGTRFWQR